MDNKTYRVVVQTDAGKTVWAGKLVAKSEDEAKDFALDYAIDTLNVIVVEEEGK